MDEVAGSSEDLLADIRNHPVVMELMEYTPGATSYMLGNAGMIVFGLFFAFMSASMASFTRSAFGDAALMPMMFALIGLSIAGYGFYRLMRLTSAPLERSIGVVVDERSEVTGTESRTTTRNYVLIEDEQGSRREFPASGKVAGSIVVGDKGVAYVRDGILLDFRRVAVQ